VLQFSVRDILGIHLLPVTVVLGKKCRYSLYKAYRVPPEHRCINTFATSVFYFKLLLVSAHFAFL
jgi:hypothetical protein